MTAGSDFIVPPRSWAEIENLANNLRCHLGLETQPRLPVIELIELVLDRKLNLLLLEVGSREEMDGAEGLTCPNGKFIMLRSDVYESVWGGDGRARFTTAHELGHWVMHTGIPMARSQRGDGTPPFRLAEPQANQFAAEILMPKRFIKHGEDEAILSERFGVSWDAARNRLRYLEKSRRY